MASLFYKTTLFGDQGVAYTVRRSARAKRVRLRVSGEGEISLTVPKLVPFWVAELFLRSKAEWVRKKMNDAVARRASSFFPLGKGSYQEHRAQALVLVTDRVKYFSEMYGFSHGRIAIRNQKTRWGSCSKKGNLSFNWKLALLPPEMADYVVVHELCHLKYFDHGKLFWELVEEGVPNYRRLRERMRQL